MPPGHLLGEVFRPAGRRSRDRPGTCWRHNVFQMAWEHHSVPQEELEEVARKGSLGISASLLPQLPRPR